MKSLYGLLGFCLCVLVNCSQPTILTRADARKAVACTEYALLALQQNTQNVDALVAKLYIANEIGSAYGVDALYVYLNRAVVEKVVTELTSNLIGGEPEALAITKITTGAKGGNHYRFHGTLGDEEVTLDARFRENGSCKIMDAHIADFGMVATLIGALSTEPPFSDLIEVDPYKL